MLVQSLAYSLDRKAWSSPLSSAADSARTLVLAFGAPQIAEEPDCIAQLARTYPRSIVVGCSSAGEIFGTEVRDRSLAVTVTKFEKTDLALASLEVQSAAGSFTAGQTLATKLRARPGLRAVMILSEGLNVNGSELVRGINSVLDDSVVVTGGLSGDGTRFKSTWVAIGANVKSNVVAAVGFYGDFVQVGHGSKGGWDKFGPERVVSRSEGNVLYELDGKPALQLYKEYLGDKAKDLPASGLLFPLSLRSSNKDDKFLVRTLLAVDHEKNSLTFAGDIPKGYLAQLMKADFDRLIGGASLATAMAKENGTPVGKDSLVVAISCVGRRLVLGERIEEEVEAVQGALPNAQQAHITGFYSYGEISPYASGHCDLHNQTMTLTVFSESATPLTARKSGVEEPKAAPPPVPARSTPPSIRKIPAAPSRTAVPAVKPSAGLKVTSFAYDTATHTWSVSAFPDADSERTLVLGFGAQELLDDPSAFAQLTTAYPKSIVVGCSSAGEIHGATVRDKSLSVTVTKFEKTDIALASFEVDGPGDSFTTGQSLARKLSSAKPGLRGILILSEGLNVNGSELVRGVNSVVDETIVVTGGLSGDGARFKQTWVAIGSKLKSNVVAAVGFYGDFVQIGHGSKGGWDKFGPERVVTRSEGNVLYELDGKPALELYKEYLGDKAKELPASGLLFPLSLRSSSKDDKYLVRTLLAVDHEKNSLTFAGDIPKGYRAQLMKADFDRLIGGASIAATMSKENGPPIGKDSLVVAISCVGRRLVLGERIEEEVEAVLDSLPKEQNAHVTGFYSYGEISPYATGHCDLHNQTMTLTVFTESPTPLPRRAPKTEQNRVTARPPPPPPRASTPLEELDLERDTSDGTRKIVPQTGFAVGDFRYDLDTKKWSLGVFPELDSPRSLVLGFGASEIMQDPSCFAALQKAYPKSIIVGCSSAGEIHGTTVRDKSLSVTVTRFDKTDLALASFEVDGPGDSFTTGQSLAKKLSSAKPGLRGILILSEGLNVNGSELVRGVNSIVDDTIVVTGGLSGDGARFKQTWVAIGSKVKSNVVAAVGFYGDFVSIGHGSKGGWDKFGPERVVTRSEGNVLYELDGKPALQLYKEYLGDKAKDLPASGLLFPLSLRSSNKDDKYLVRTLLAVDHEKNSLTFAGDIPKGYQAQLMKADFDRLIGGASIAAAMAKDNGVPIGKDALVVAISCVGRRLVLGERIEEEVEAVLDSLPKEQSAHVTGFYSYGEISPYATGHCDLHNQTMTLTVFTESPTPLPRRVPTRTGAHAPVAAPPTPPPAPKPAPPPRISAAPESSPSVTAQSLLVPLTPPQPPSAPGSSPSSGISGAIRRPGTVITRTPPQASNATTAVVQKQARGSVTLLSITGRLTEAFKGEALGRELRGTVAIDLGGVERITSFGVREWLAMLGAMQDVRRLYLLRCSEAVVNQLSMIRKFVGNGQIVSFFAPYLCSTCGEPFEREFDCEAEGDAIRNGQAPDAACAHCGGNGSFDDDARSYFAFAASHLNTPVPEEVRAIQNELDAAAPTPSRDAVDKTVEGNVTRVRVAGKIGPNVRWKRVLDGIEGALVIDFGSATGVEQAGVANFEQALTGLGSEVTSIGIERCPAILVEHFASAGLPRRVTVSSGTLDAYCNACAVHRPALVSITEHADALATGTPPRVHCKRCNGELTLKNAERALGFLKGQVTRTSGAPESQGATPGMPMSLGGMSIAPRQIPTTETLGPVPIPPPKSRGLVYAIGALSLAVVGLAGVQALRSNPAPATAAATPAVQPVTSSVAAKEAPSATAAAATNWMQSVDLPPAWVERPFVIDTNDVFVVGKSEGSASNEAAMTNARNDAIVRIVRQINSELTGSPVGDFVQPRIREDKTANDSIAARFEKQFATTASPERVDAALRKRDSGIEGFARYRLSKATYQQLVSSYRETTNVHGMVVARFFPLLETSLHTDGDLVVISVQKGRPADALGVRAGDIVLSVGSHPVQTPEAYTKAATDEWTSTPARGQFTIEMESAGAKRAIKITKPSPNQ